MALPLLWKRIWDKEQLQETRRNSPLRHPQPRLPTVWKDSEEQKLSPKPYDNGAWS